MRPAGPILMLTFGVAIGITFTLSCEQDNPSRADAADASMCNCPPAEPPIFGRVVEVKANYVIPANTHGTHGEICPGVSPGIVLNGGCTAEPPQPNGSIVLEQSAPDADGWDCSWNNPSFVDVPVHVIVRCLMPAQ